MYDFTLTTLVLALNLRKINGDASRGLFSSFSLIFRLLQLKKRQTEKKKEKKCVE